MAVAGTTVIWKQGPQVVSPAAWDYPHFRPHEFADPTSGEIGMTLHFMECIENLRKRYGKPIRINSGWRSPDHNRAVGGSPHSQHLYGRAADLHIPRDDLYRVIHYAQEAGFTGLGIRAVLGTEHSHDELHVDVGALTPPGYDGRSPRPRVWTYQRRRSR